VEAFLHFLPTSAVSHTHTHPSHSQTSRLLSIPKERDGKESNYLLSSSKSEFFFSLLVQIERRKASKAPKNRFSAKCKENTFLRCSTSLHFGGSPVANKLKKRIQLYYDSVRG
jgi:hypothetical protein